jgi:hypothetical protein
MDAAEIDRTSIVGVLKIFPKIVTRKSKALVSRATDPSSSVRN